MATRRMRFRLCSNLLVLILTLTFHACAGQSTGDTLDGYAFDCGGVLRGFQGMNQIVCLAGGKMNTCGSYEYDEASNYLTGQASSLGRFLAFDLEIHDGILVRFSSDLGESCHAVTLDWRQYSALSFMGLTCPEHVQINKFTNGHQQQQQQQQQQQHHNQNNLVAYETNHFSLGPSGDVALRSPLLFISGRRLVRDFYGVYVYHAATESIRLYFGAQGPQQEGMTILMHGRLNFEGELFLPDPISMGLPCRHDGTSLIHNVTELMPTIDVLWDTLGETNKKINFIRVSHHAIGQGSLWILASISVFGLGLGFGLLARRRPQ